MTGPLVLGIDVGTTSLKAVLLDPEQGITAQTDRPHDLISPQPGWAEEDPDQWWETTVSAIAELLQQTSPESVAAVGVAGMVPALILLDGAGSPLRPSIQQNDARASAEVEALQRDVDTDEFFRITGGVPNQQNVDPRWRWLREHEPAIVDRTATLFGSYDFIAFRLTGVRSLEENWAAESGLYDIRDHTWHQAYLDHAGIPSHILPTVKAATDIIGGISEEAAQATGLRAGTPVVAGSADHVAAALGAGATQPGDLVLKFGGAGDILYCADEPTPDRHFYFDYHDVPGLTLINGCMAASGSLVKWFSRELAGGESPANLDREAAEIPPGSGGIVVLPYFLGEKTPIFDPLARGVFCGVMLHHTRAHLYHAILEAVCYGFAHHVVLLEEAGWPIRRVFATDGGSQSALWMQIAADVLNRPVNVVGGENASALAVAIVAGMGAGILDDWKDSTRYAPIGAVFEPRAEQASLYAEGFSIYRRLYQQLQPIMPELACLDRRAEKGRDHG
jgi:xylulokinase